VAADCPDATEKVLDVWPLPLEPWLPAAEKGRRVFLRINSLSASG
jgi:hypothetical protein